MCGQPDVLAYCSPVVSSKHRAAAAALVVRRRLCSPVDAVVEAVEVVVVVQCATSVRKTIAHSVVALHQVA
jgi:hypothetical protein